MADITSSPEAIAAIDQLFDKLQREMVPQDFDAVLAYVKNKYLFGI